ncbi:hypothetical protein [uncultured Pseudoteredinibacter sp.]|uniref:hypothetical protein n=1 Tax=uncultured Pseudoteredinibacter sp. TaxID=1641701 RepID=UPI00260986DE|nr:hypothetical protein [uncultured Pseudoteredinibacter sp.]
MFNLKKNKTISLAIFLLLAAIGLFFIGGHENTTVDDLVAPQLSQKPNLSPPDTQKVETPDEPKKVERQKSDAKQAEIDSARTGPPPFVYTPEHWKALQEKANNQQNLFSSELWSDAEFDSYIQLLEKGDSSAIVNFLHIYANCRTKFREMIQENCAKMNRWRLDKEFEDPNFSLFDEFEKLVFAGDELASYLYYRVLEDAIESEDVNIRAFPEKWIARRDRVRAHLMEQTIQGSPGAGMSLMFDALFGINGPVDLVRAAAIGRYLHEQSPELLFEFENITDDFVLRHGIDAAEVEVVYQYLFGHL